MHFKVVRPLLVQSEQYLHDWERVVIKVFVDVRGNQLEGGYYKN